MSKPGLKITTKEQFKRLVQLMEDNPEIARGKMKFGMTKKEYKKIWQRFAMELNSLGPPTRTPAKWQRVWIHYKASIKRKLANNKTKTLNSLEDSVLQILALNEQVTLPGQTFLVENIALEAMDTTVKLENTTTEADEYDDLPEKEQTETQTRDEILETLKSLERIEHENYEINKQILKIKQKKLALYERQANEATELHNIRMEYEKMKIESLKKEMNT